MVFFFPELLNSTLKFGKFCYETPEKRKQSKICLKIMTKLFAQVLYSVLSCRICTSLQGSDESLYREYSILQYLAFTHEPISLPCFDISLHRLPYFIKENFIFMPKIEMFHTL